MKEEFRVTTPPTLQQSSKDLRIPNHFTATDFNNFSIKIDQEQQRNEYIKKLQFKQLKKRPAMKQITLDQQNHILSDADYKQSLEKYSVKRTPNVNLSKIQVKKTKIPQVKRANVVSPKTAALGLDIKKNETCFSPSKYKYFATSFQESEIMDAVKFPDLSGRIVMGQEVRINEHNIVYAFGSKCCHQGAALSHGEMIDIEDSNRVCLVCPRHKWKFDAATGVCVGNGNFKQSVYPTRISENSFVEVGFREFHNDVFNPDMFDD
eukprot:snap_masked-scaffold_17-processed-gene-6.55-mRNA-1 protein AED:0.46 eAED:0.49 QI:0/0/0/1/1/1/2/0/263